MLTLVIPLGLALSLQLAFWDWHGACSLKKKENQSVGLEEQDCIYFGNLIRR